MEFINTNFVSLRDLDSIDEKINSLSGEKLQYQKRIENLASPSQNASIQEENLYIEGLLTSIQQLAQSGSELIIDNLIEQNGSLRVLLDLKEAISEKSKLQAENELLKQAERAERKVLAINETTKVEELLKINEEIERLQNLDAKSTLSLLLLEVVQSRKEKHTETLSNLLEAVKWLSTKSSVTISSSTLKSISQTFAELVNLQVVVGVPQYPDSWWALQTLVHPFSVRFKYHFSQSSDTNKISRPEWALQFVETFLRDNLSVLELVIGNTFSAQGKIAVMEILTAVLVPARNKLQKMSVAINEHIEADDEANLERNGRLLSHLIFETTLFDQRLRNAYKYNPYIESIEKTPTKKWMGLTGDILLGEEKSVNNWLSLELRLAKQRFDTEIVGSENAFDIDFEYGALSKDADTLRPSYSAFGVVKLFDNLTSHFKTLSIVKYQLKYVSNIQLSLLDEYLVHLQSQFKQFNEQFSLNLILNYLPGKTEPASSTQSGVANGLKGLEVLSGIYCSIKFVVDHMQEWSEELLFVQLWNSYRSILAKKEKDDSIFESTIALYNALLAKVAAKYEEFFKKEIKNSFKDYVNSVTWTIDSQDPDHPSAQLSTLTTIVPAYMAYLQRTLPSIDYFLVASQVCDCYSTILHEYVITNNQFSKAGLQQLRVDLDFLEDNLAGPLLMGPGELSTAGNKKYRKVLQSVEMMETFDAGTARSLKRDVELNDAIREMFENRLDCLSEGDIRDLLFRIA